MKNNNTNIDLQHIGKEMVRIAKLAIGIIQDESHEIIVNDKVGYDGIKEDFATNGDKKAQAMYITELTRLFPRFGIIAEEADLTIPCTHPQHNVYFTVDPLDGTKAYIRKQSHGVGTMISLVCDDEIVAVVVGDINTGEVFHYTDWNSVGVVVRERFGRTTALTPDLRPLKKQYILLRDAVWAQPAIMQKMVLPPDQNGLFKDVEIGGGSIGLAFARLWKGEVGAILLKPGFVTPWDETPFLGITNRLGFKRFQLDHNTNTFTEHDTPQQTTINEHHYGELFIHETHVEEFKEWLATQT